MRKIIALFMVICMLFAIPTVVSAEELDLSTLTDEEICELSSRIQQEFVERNIQKSAEIPAGTYTVGEEIPAGSYDLTISMGESGSVYIGCMNEDGTEESSKLWKVYTEEDTAEKEQVLHIDLAENEALQVDMPVIMKISKGVVFE